MWSNQDHCGIDTPFSVALSDLKQLVGTHGGLDVAVAYPRCMVFHGYQVIAAYNGQPVWNSSPVRSPNEVKYMMHSGFRPLNEVMVLCNDTNQLSFYHSWRWNGRLEAHWLILHHDDSDDYPGASKFRVEIQLLLTLFWRLTTASCFGASLLSWDRCMKSNKWFILRLDLSTKRWCSAKTLISWAVYI